MFTLKLDKAKSQFFDRQGILSKVDKATAKILSKHGANTRTAAQRSIRYRKAASRPGSPPSAHRTGMRKNKKTGKTQAVSPLRQHIYFAYLPEQRTVYVGPVLLNGMSGKALPALEYGGVSSVKARRGKQFKTVYIRARPFMWPAGRKEEQKLNPMWLNSIR